MHAHIWFGFRMDGHNVKQFCQLAEANTSGVEGQDSGFAAVFLKQNFYMKGQTPDKQPLSRLGIRQTFCWK